MKELCEIQKCTMYTSLERPSSCFQLIVGTTNTDDLCSSQPPFSHSREARTMKSSLG